MTDIGALLWGVASSEMVLANAVVNPPEQDPERRATAEERAELDRMQWQC